VRIWIVEEDGHKEDVWFKDVGYLLYTLSKFKLVSSTRISSEHQMHMWNEGHMQCDRQGCKEFRRS
jgi:hypothetical protein